MRFNIKLSGKKVIFTVILLLIICAIIALRFSNWQGNVPPELCITCHSMKPEYYTWQLSSHSKIACGECHTPSLGESNYFGYKVKWLKEVGLTITDNYPAPIRQIEQLPDRNCERCHNMSKRLVSPTGDLIIPHDVHKKMGIACTKCHSGIAHADLPDRGVSYKSDYNRWNFTQAKTFMDTKYTEPQMDECLKCHKLRNGPLACAACHSTGMEPFSHKEKKFATEHGIEARKNLSYCESCHGLMSDKKVNGFEIPDAYKQFMNPKQQKRPVKVDYYAKTNTFCKSCHAIRPASHSKDFIQTHGPLAARNMSNCLVCHSNYPMGKDAPTKVACASCHPAMHTFDWRKGHPVVLPPKPKLTDFCYKCHVRMKCSSCHGN